MTPYSSVKAVWRARGYVLNGYVSMPSPAACELYAIQGWDSVTLDMEHGSIGFDVAVEMLRSIHSAGVLPLVRIPRGDPSWIAGLLDAGVMGVTAAMINTVEDAQRLVQACRYPPTGERGMSRMSRAAMMHGADYAKTANSNINLFAMVETAQAMDNLEGIAAVPGIDGIYFGGVDYEMSLRSDPRTRDLTEPQAREAVLRARQAVAEVCRRRDILAGMNANSATVADQLHTEGYRFITLSSDAAAMTSQARAWVGGARELFDAKSQT
jgi:4-hydroxy-2-oxoheptanedioate aldolase